MVRRLVEHEAVRAAEHQQEQVEARELAAGERGGLASRLLVVEEELHQQRDGLALGAAVVRAHDLEHRLALEARLRALREVADADGWSLPDLAVDRLVFADDELQQHGFARAVRADDADALAAQDGQVRADQDRVVVELHRDGAEVDDALAAALVRVEVQRDLAESNIRVQTMTFDEAKKLVRDSKRAAELSSLRIRWPSASLHCRAMRTAIWSMVLRASE